LPLVSSILEPEASFGFIAMKPRYISPIIACDYKDKSFGGMRYHQN
jgi:hypothetical protein